MASLKREMLLIIATGKAAQSASEEEIELRCSTNQEIEYVIFPDVTGSVNKTVISFNCPSFSLVLYFSCR